MKNQSIICFVVCIFIIYFAIQYSNKIMETFATITCSNAHGSEPPGFGSSPGNVQHTQNANALHVNPMYKEGNPQNVFGEFKLQPV